MATAKSTSRKTSPMYAHEAEEVQKVRETLLEELPDLPNRPKIFVAWKDQKAKLVNMTIEAGYCVPQKKFLDLVEEDLPHGIFSYKQFPPTASRSWGETRILFHI